MSASGPPFFPDNNEHYSSFARGIDVSHWRVVSDWKALKDSGISFIGIKATEGNKTVDSSLAFHRVNAREAKFDMVIYYHFARSGDARAQAARFIAAVGPLQPNEFLCLDLEVLVTDQNRMVRWLEDFYSVLELRVQDRHHFIYTSKRIWDSFGSPDWSLGTTHVSLWAPRYNDQGNEPLIPGPWKTSGKQWCIWQWSDGETPPSHVPGIGPCDTNLWHGPRSELLSWIANWGPQPVVAASQFSLAEHFVEGLDDSQFGILRSVLADDVERDRLFKALSKV